MSLLIQIIEEMSPIINTLQKENKYATIVGDFNINLLQINEREKFDEFFDLMCTNNFFPKIQDLCSSFVSKWPNTNSQPSILLQLIKPFIVIFVYSTYLPYQGHSCPSRSESARDGMALSPAARFFFPDCNLKY